MLEKYIHFIKTNLSDFAEPKLLLAVSGGVDSMVMLDLTIKAELNFAVAHINHKMRDIASEKDAHLVKNICIQYGINYHQYNFSDEQKTKGNFQENARNIRYNWMNELCLKNGYSNILTAHHSSDSVETFFINLMRGTGLNGLTGIPSINGNIMRPMLQFNKAEISQYALEYNIEYRFDSSNADNKYRRNLIRNEWLPFLSKTGLEVEKKVTQTISNLSRDRFLLEQLISREIEKIVAVNDKGYQTFDISNYNPDNHDFIRQILYHHLRAYNFSFDNIIKCLSAETGSIFSSNTHELLKDRNNLILRELESSSLINTSISKYGIVTLENFNITISEKESDNGLVINNLEFPFTIRTWKSGDRFQPFGMRGASKKVKDFLTDMKLDSWSKKSTLVIEKDDIIIAVLPYRVAEGYYDISSQTQVCIQLNHI